MIGTSCSGLWAAAQVVWWSTLSEKYEEDMKQQADIFGGAYGEQALKDFRCVMFFSVLPCCCSEHPFFFILPSCSASFRKFHTPHFVAAESDCRPMHKIAFRPAQLHAGSTKRLTSA